MTALRPERDGAPYGEYDAENAYAYGDNSVLGEHATLGEHLGDAHRRNTTAFEAAAYGDAARFHAGDYGDAEAFEAAVEQLADPLNDPLPGQGAHTRDPSGRSTPGQHARGAPAQDASAGAYRSGYEPSAGEPRAAQGRHSSEWFREERPQPPAPAGPHPFQGPHQLQQPHELHAPQQSQQLPRPPRRPSSHRKPPEGLQEAAQPGPEPAYDTSVTGETTVGLHTADTRRAAERGAGTGHEANPAADGAAPVGGTDGSDEAGAAAGAAAVGAAAAVGIAEGAVAGGRAARRRAAKQRGGGGGRRRAGARQESSSAGRGGHRARGHRAGSEPVEATGGQGEAESAPLTRVEARRAARAAKPSPGVIASRAVGELFISIGVLMLLFVTYQLWWTNVRAHQEADGAAHSLQDTWAKGKGKPGVFAPGQGFAIMHIPKLDVIVPIAQGTDKHKVLDRGMVGHYGGPDDIQTAMPDAKTGNFAVAGHRNTHGEPFRYINRLARGDDIVVETQDTYYVYKVANTLPQTPPSNIAVINPVPPGSGFTTRGRYITLTTCTPEYTSKYRLIVWGKMVEERPRSEGKPPVLVN